jgi:molybdopterin-guanine dinucleotide biosynthesis protein B
MRHVFGITGWKNTGKTTLTVRLVEHFAARGIVVSTIKHAHHAADVDQEGTDSFKHRSAGAREVVLATPLRFALMHELRSGEDEPSLDALLARMEPVDLILVEGYKRENFPKIMAYRTDGATGRSGIDIPNIVAYASDNPDEHTDAEVPVFHADDIEAIADFILGFVGLAEAEGT